MKKISSGVAMINKFKIFFLFLLLFNTLAYASSETCYSIQFVSSYIPVNIEKYPSGSKMMKIGKFYTVRYGCFENFKYAKKVLSKFKDKYPAAMIVSTYKWRFKKQNKKLKQKNNIPEKKEESINILDILSKKFSSKKTTIPQSSFSQNKIVDKEKECYTVALSIGKEKPKEKDFPFGTKIIKRDDRFIASYGCYSNIKDAKSTLNEIRKTIPEAIIILLPKSYFEDKMKVRSLSLNKRDISTYSNITQLKEEKPDIKKFYKTDNKSITIKEEKKCSPKIEKFIIPCKKEINTLQIKWENVNLNTIENYVDTKLYKEIYMEPIQPYYSTSLSTKKTYNLLKEKFNFYIATTLNIKNGQKDSTGKLLKTRSLNIMPGFTYLYNFNPWWYFYTDDRLILRIKESSTDLHIDVRELYIKSRNLFYNYANFLIGRKYLKDRRGWYYRTYLDTIGLFNKNDLLLYEIYLGERLTKNTSSYDPNEVATNLKNAKFFFGHLSYEFFKENTVEGFFIHENNKNARKKLNWLGLRVQGSIPQNYSNILSYWGDIARVNGDFKGSSIKGLGFDVGAKYYFEKYLTAIAGSLAYGSGGNNLFVQPSFTNNRSNYLSKDVSFYYYGEFLQPELSNITISSLYLLHYFDIFKEKSLILAFHNYLQNKASKIQYIATNKTINPNGKKKNIGNEIDLILHYDLFRNSYWRFSIGYFIGGNAFDSQTNKKDGFSGQIYFKYIW